MSIFSLGTCVVMWNRKCCLSYSHAPSHIIGKERKITTARQARTVEISSSSQLGTEPLKSQLPKQEQLSSWLNDNQLDNMNASMSQPNPLRGYLVSHGHGY
ncbi:hypothetical protein BaRGS_00014823 [Batillaria attramentaria]|uniref:Uncharacterized protein n=1 Tax=Batillaria attramentaria TaxID=370345 RepID=A0ABD0L3U5_9CAEN